MAGKNAACAPYQLVPCRHKFQESRPKTYLKPANEKTVGGYFCKASCPVLEEGKNSPADIQKRYNIIHRDECEEKHEWDLANDCADRVHCLQLHELIPFEPEILFQSRNVCIVLSWR